MALLHLSISAANPGLVSRFLAHILGGKAMPFPPFPECWIAFSETDDGSAIEVYPVTHTLSAGPDTVACDVGDPVRMPTFVHAAVSTSLDRSEVLAAAKAQGWTARVCHRGPFECVEVWLENRLLVEVLDPVMADDYRRAMTMANWARMFGLPRAEPIESKKS